MSTTTQPDTTMDVTKVPSRIKGGTVVAYSSAIHHTDGSHPIRIIAVHLPEAEQYAVWDLVYDQDRGRYFVLSGDYVPYGEYAPLGPSEALQKAVDRAKTYAMEQALKLKKGQSSLWRGEVTLARVLTLYRKHRTHKKSEREQHADGRRIDMWRRVLGSTIDPHDISLREWETFIEARSSGAIDARGRPVPKTKECPKCEGPSGSDHDCDRCEGAGTVNPRRPVRARAVEADCDWLRWVFNWATDFTVDGSRLMRETPLTKRFQNQVPTEKNPRRPVATWDRYEAIRARTDDVTMEVEWADEPDVIRSHLSELLDLAVATGRRLLAIRCLRYKDLRLTKTHKAPHGAIFWPADTDKSGKESTVPLSPLGRQAIDRVLRERPGVGDTPLFPSPADQTEPVSRHIADKWLREAEELAGVEPQEGTLWHAYRRMWVTARKDLPAQDVAKAGGWDTVRMVEEVYTQADEETTLNVVLHEGRVREAK